MSANVCHENPGSGIGQATLPHAARLVKPSEFKRVFERNAGSSDACFRIIACPSTADESRIGLAVSKKVEKHAVGRNRIKRVVRESFRHWRAQAARRDEKAMDIVVLARPAAATICNKQLFRSLEQHWNRLPPALARKFPGKRQPEEN